MSVGYLPNRQLFFSVEELLLCSGFLLNAALLIGIRNMKNNIVRSIATQASWLLLLCTVSSASQARIVGEVLWMAGDFCPRGTLVANGDDLPASESPELYPLLGNTYGGNSTYFKLPNLVGASLIGVGQGAGLNKYALGDSGGAIEHEVKGENTPAHSHTLTKVTAAMQASSAAGDSKEPLNNYFAKADSKMYAKASGSPQGGAMAVISGSSKTNASASTMTITGRSPYFVLTPCIVSTGQYLNS